MPEVYLVSGAMVVCDPEDYDLVTESVWRILCIRGNTQAVRDAQSRRRRFRLLLHREIAFRLHPGMVKTPSRMTVRPANGNFLDVRRANLEISIRRRTRGGSKRPAGSKNGEFRASGRGPRPRLPPAWARSASSALPHDGAPGGQAPGAR